MHKSLMTTSIVKVSQASAYYAVVNVPFELQETVGKTRIYKSLSTLDKDEATAALPTVTHEIRNALIELFRVLLAEVETTSGLVGGEDVCRDIVLTPKTRPYSRKVQAALDRLGLINAGNRIRCSDEEAIKICKLADRLISQCRLTLPRFSREYWILCNAIRRIQKDASFRDFEDEPDSPVHGGRLDNEGFRVFLASATLGDVIRRYRTEASPRWSVHSRNLYTRQFEVVVELLGEHTPIRNLTRADFKRMRDIIDDLPPNYELVSALKGLSIRSAAARAKNLGIKGRSYGTVNKLMTVCSSLMNYSEAEGFVEKSCAIGLFRRLPVHLAKKVQPFSSDQLSRFFSSSPVYDPTISEFIRDGRFWAPLISLFQGLRLSEITQLQTPDIITINEVPLFSVASSQDEQDADGKTVKTSHSRRLVPIHPELQRMGFLRYHREIVSAGFTPLFPDLRRNEYTRQYEQFSQQVTRDMATSNIRSAHHSFRSFRHNFRDALREANTSDEMVRRLGGWTLRSIADEYGAGPSVRRLYEEVCKVSYPGFNVSHLYLAGIEAAPIPGA